MIPCLLALGLFLYALCFVQYSSASHTPILNLLLSKLYPNLALGLRGEVKKLQANSSWVLLGMHLFPHFYLWANPFVSSTCCFYFYLCADLSSTCCANLYSVSHF